MRSSARLHSTRLHFSSTKSVRQFRLVSSRVLSSPSASRQRQRAAARAPPLRVRLVTSPSPIRLALILLSCVPLLSNLIAMHCNCNALFFLVTVLRDVFYRLSYWTPAMETARAELLNGTFLIRTYSIYQITEYTSMYDMYCTVLNSSVLCRSKQINTCVLNRSGQVI